MSEFDVKAMLFTFDQLGDTYLRDEVEEALKHREELTPHLITIIETVAENPLLYSLEQRNAHVYAATLLSHFGEAAAHLPFIRAFSIPEEQLVDIWGDMTTEILPTMLYRTSNGSMVAIKELITNRDVDQFVRCAAMEALSYFVVFQPFHRDEVIRFLQGLFSGDEAPRDSYFWGNLAATLCDLHPEESMATIGAAFDKGLIHKGFISPENIEEAKSKTQAEAMERLQSWVYARMPADVHAYVSWFAEFQQEELEQPVKPPKHKGKKTEKQPKKKTAKKSSKKNRG